MLYILYFYLLGANDGRAVLVGAVVVVPLFGVPGVLLVGDGVVGAID